MPSYLVESCLPRATDALEEASQHPRRAAQFADGDGLGVRYVRTTLLETDETCFHVFDASSLSELETVLSGVRFEADRIARADETSAAEAAPTEAGQVSSKGAIT